MKKIFATAAAVVAVMTMLAGCSNGETNQSGESMQSTQSNQSTQSTQSTQSAQSTQPTESSTVSSDASSSVTSTSSETSSSESSEPSMTEGLSPVAASSVKNGEYDITVDTSSSMFKIASCKLTVADGKMTAVMTMSGTGYLYLFMGTGEQAANDERAYIPFVENAEGAHTFTVPVEALNTEIPVSAFSKSKEKWYDRTLVFRADSLPADAFTESVFTTVADLSLKDGEYTIDVKLEGGSGKTKVTTPTKLIVKDGAATAEVEFSSSKYDYMKVDGTKYDMINTEGNSKFLIPVSGFDYKMPVSANTTAMGNPHEIEYTLFFDSKTIK